MTAIDSLQHAPVSYGTSPFSLWLFGALQHRRTIVMLGSRQAFVRFGPTRGKAGNMWDGEQTLMRVFDRNYFLWTLLSFIRWITAWFDAI
jgi:hypothetical protein